MKRIINLLSPHKSLKHHIRDSWVSFKYRVINFFKDLAEEYRENFKHLKYNLSWLLNRNLQSEILTIAMTKKCNLECTYCWDTGTRENLGEMTTEQIFKTLDNAWDMGIRRFNPFGGEPFIRKDMFDILDYSLEKGFEVTITTNGTLMSEEKCIKLVEKIEESQKRRFIVLVSLDGSTQTENDYIRGKNSFRKTVQVLETLQRERARRNVDMGIIINTVVSRNNFKTMNQMVELCKLIGADCVHFITPTISLESEMHMKGMVIRNLVILPEEFTELDKSIDSIKKLKKEQGDSSVILNQVESLEQFKGFFRRQYEQHRPYIETH